MYFLRIHACFAGEYPYNAVLYQLTSAKSSLDTNYCVKCVSEYVVDEDIWLLSKKLQNIGNKQIGGDG
jgi:hypothetical protein